MRRRLRGGRVLLGAGDGALAWLDRPDGDGRRRDPAFLNLPTLLLDFGHRVQCPPFRRDAALFALGFALPARATQAAYGAANGAVCAVGAVPVGWGKGGRPHGHVAHGS